MRLHIPERLGDGPALNPSRVEYPESLWESWFDPSEVMGMLSSCRWRSTAEVIESGPPWLMPPPWPLRPSCDEAALISPPFM